jgi:hypothetical protein
MAKVSRKALQQIYDTLGEILNAASAEDAAKRAKDDNVNELDREDNDRARAQDSPRGMDSARAVRRLVPGYDRLRDGSGGRGDAPPDHGLRPSGRSIGRDGREIS